MIKPTVGRVVWYYPKADFQGMWDASQPLAAIVTFVYTDYEINLAVFDNEGMHYNDTHVVLWQDTDKAPDPPFAVWMPYQIGQVKAQTQV